ncbi:MAG: 16S rRNA pseudouridine(516) synthase [Ruminococcus sp.]|nr:16S rRNA pseudouridine(516) synthase [Ruminococcus sp.]
MALIRLDRYISERTEYTRSQIKQLASKGRISVNGAAVRKCDLKIDDGQAEVIVDGNPVKSQKFRYILLNKPAGYVSSTDSSDGPSVLELVPPELRTKGLFPAGRLDKDSTGALLITDDGELAHRILSPRSHVPKIYIVKLAKSYQSKYVDLFRSGIVLNDGYVCMPARVRAFENSDKLAFVEISEGKFHQVKRMFNSVGNCVEKLMRISVGGVILPEKLAVGQCMELLHKDVENLFRPPDFDDFCRNFIGEFSAFQLNNLP